MLDWVARYVDHALVAVSDSPAPDLAARSALAPQPGSLDIVCTDPPYYDAIPYSDLMDFFHVWLRRALHGVSPEIDAVFAEPLGPKWGTAENDGELIDDASRFEGDRHASKKNYEDGMARAFERCHQALRDDGHLVVVFANKNPDAWETLVSALIRAGFCGDRLLAHPDRDANPPARHGVRRARLFHLACLPEAPPRPTWLGIQGA